MPESPASLWVRLAVVQTCTISANEAFAGIVGQGVSDTLY
jgi:hypothetical protein